MDIKYLCPHWGSEEKSASVFLEGVLKEGYDGIEINLPEDEHFLTEFGGALEMIKQQQEFTFVAQSVPDTIIETADEHILRIQQRLEALVALQPDFINSHTGKDHFSFSDNCRIIEAVESIAARSGIKILHETHRGRFTFHTSTLLPYLEKFPEMELVADYSHWCTVSESMLADQQHILKEIMPHVSHIHARVGHEQAPQVCDPFAPEWQEHLSTFIVWWNEILRYKAWRGLGSFTITPEFGPAPYMPSLPFTRQPMGDQWAINSKIKNYLKTNLI